MRVNVKELSRKQNLASKTITICILFSFLFFYNTAVMTRHCFPKLIYKPKHYLPVEFPSVNFITLHLYFCEVLLHDYLQVNEIDRS